MAISLNSLERNNKPKPARLLVYGVAGIGKTSLGASAPSPVVIRTEDGLGTIDVSAFPLARTFEEVIEALTVLATEKHDFKTVVVDSLDWLEPLIWNHTCRTNNWKSIEDPGYGKGYVEAMAGWREYVDAINYLRDEIGMTIIQTAHCHIKRFESPETEPYDRYKVKLHNSASELLMEHSDCVIFANYRVGTTKSDVGFNKKVTRAIGSGERVLNTQERPAFLAKERYGLPEQIPLLRENAFNEIAQYIPFYQQKEEVNG